jgi:hypothetical protein
MRPKILTAAGLVLAFLIGAMANGMYTVRTRAFDLGEEKSVALEKNPQPSQAVSRTHLVQPKVVYASSPAPVANPVKATQKKRTVAKEALIVGGSAGAGAAIGAVAGGKKGAAIGAMSGGVAGLIYDIATRNN